MRVPALAALAWLGLGLSAHAAPAVEDLWIEVGDDATAAQVRSMGLGFVEGQEGAWLRFHGEPGSGRALSLAGINWKAAEPATRTGSGYHGPDDIAAALDALVTSAPELATRVDVGLSVQEQTLAGVLISATDTPRARWRVLGAHHGDEQSSSELALATARALVEGYGSDAVYTALLDRDEVWVVPQVNPDGVVENSRYNANGVDLNRNYGYEWSATEYRPGSAPFSEPETRAMRALAAWTPFGAGLSMHSGATNLGWVWNHTTQPTDDEVLLEQLADAYADACTLPGFWTTNGADWYVTHGDTNDWSYGRHGTLDFTLEISSVKTPPSDLIDEFNDHHLPAVRAFFEAVELVSGVVVDEETGLGLPARITLDGLDRPLTTGPEGDFARPVLGGSWQVTVSAPGYTSVSTSLTADAAPARIALTRDSLSDIRPNPALLSWGGSGQFRLPVDAVSVVLWRPDADAVVATAVGDDWQVDTTGLAPGPWTLLVDDAVAPRALFVGEADDRVELEGASVADGQLTIHAHGLGASPRAWALGGLARQPVPLPVLDATPTRLVIDLSQLPDLGDAPVDVVVLSQGHQLAVLDVLDDVVVDTGAPGDTGRGDTGGSASDSGALRADDADSWRACGCSALPGRGTTTWLPVALLLSLAAAARRSGGPSLPGAPSPTLRPTSSTTPQRSRP